MEKDLGLLLVATVTKVSVRISWSGLDEKRWRSTDGKFLERPHLLQNVYRVSQIMEQDKFAGSLSLGL